MGRLLVYEWVALPHYQTALHVRSIIKHWCARHEKPPCLLSKESVEYGLAQSDPIHLSFLLICFFKAE